MLKTHACSLAAVVGWIALFAREDCQASSPPDRRPNILWLTVEDMSPWLPCYGDATVATPALTQLAKESLRFTNAFATSAVCAPSRATLITGMYATRIGAMHHRTSGFSFAGGKQNKQARGYEAVPPPFVRCFSETLRAAGYYCTNNSKQDYQFRPPVTAWDESSPKAHWKNRPAGQPFFAVFNYLGTHESQAFPAATRQPEVVDRARVPLPPFYPDTPAVRDAVARTYDNIAAMDGWVSVRLAELAKAHLDEETIVFFFSDHGVGLPRGKRSLYDSGTRVPLLIRLPQSAGASTDRVVSFVDFGPTVLSLAGEEPDRRLDGVPFLGEFKKPDTGLAFAHADRFDEVVDTARTVTDGRYRYIRNLDVSVPYLLPNSYREGLPMMQDLYALVGSPQATPSQWQMAAKTRRSEELYDSHTDPSHVRDRADDPAMAEKKAELRRALDAWMKSTGDLGLVRPEEQMVRERLWQGATNQPRTAPPQCRRTGEQVGISCATAGASIGYRFRKDLPWQVYTGEFAAPHFGILQVVAHRIGWKPTRITWDLAAP